MVAVAVCTLADSGEPLAIKPVTVRKPPRSSCSTMLLSSATAVSVYLNACTTISELGRSVMRVPSCSLKITVAPSPVVKRSPSLRANPLPMARGNWVPVWAKATPRTNSTSPAC